MGDRGRVSRWLIGAVFAVVMLEGCLASEPTQVRAAREALNQADIALALRRPAAAEAGYREALALDPESAEALLGLARAHAALGQSAEALGSYEALAARHPERFAALRDGEYCRAVLAAASDRLASGEAEASLTLTDRGLAEGCASPDLVTARTNARFALADQLRVAGEGVAAGELYREVAESDPSRIEAWRAAGALLLATDRRSEALRLLSEALRHHPRDPDLKELMVDALVTTDAPQDSP